MRVRIARIAAKIVAQTRRPANHNANRSAVWRIVVVALRVVAASHIA
jgi:hypothetical protein